MSYPAKMNLDYDQPIKIAEGIYRDVRLTFMMHQSVAGEMYP